MDETTRKEIQRIAARTLRDAGLTEPPLSVEGLLEHVKLYRDYYDLSDPGFLDRAKYKLKIHGRRLVETVNKVRLRAVFLFHENRICIDNDLPRIKRPIMRRLACSFWVIVSLGMRAMFSRQSPA